MKHHSPSWVPMIVPLLSGCATTLEPVGPDFEFGDPPASVAVGRVEYVYDERTPSATSEGFVRVLGNPTLAMEAVASGEAYEISLDGSRSDFFVEIPPGSYVVTRWTSGRLEGALRGRFTVRPGEIAYLGTLRFTREQGVGSFLQEAFLNWMPGVWTVEDEYDKTVKGLRDRCPRLTQPVLRALIRLE